MGKSASIGDDGNEISSKRKLTLYKTNRRSQSLDRISEETNSDSKEERRTRRQFMHLVC